MYSTFYGPSTYNNNNLLQSILGITSVEFDGKRRSTGASLFGLGVGQHSKTRSDEFLVVVQRGTGTVVHRYCIDHHPSVCRAKDDVVRIHRFIKVEFVLKPRAATTLNGDSEESAIVANLL